MRISWGGHGFPTLRGHSYAAVMLLQSAGKREVLLLPLLLRGSALELLVAVPCHVIVRRRDDCSAPVVTGFGIVTGIAIMLLSFGLSVLLLYQKAHGCVREPSVSIAVSWNRATPRPAE
jgi:hypothetical protein